MFKKISTEAENLRNLWVIKLDLKGKLEMASPEDFKAYESIKEEVLLVFLMMYAVVCYKSLYMTSMIKN